MNGGSPIRRVGVMIEIDPKQTFNVRVLPRRIRSVAS
jgi:hypothetical protein